MPFVTITNVTRHSPAVEVMLRRILRNQEIIMANTQLTLEDVAAINAAVKVRVQAIDIQRG